MKNFLFILMPSIFGFMMYSGGGFAITASWLMVFFGVQGMLIVLLSPTRGGAELRKSLRSRNMSFYLSSEILTLYSVFMCISYGWLPTAFIYIIGMICEMSAVLYSRGLGDEE